MREARSKVVGIEEEERQEKKRKSMKKVEKEQI